MLSWPRDRPDDYSRSVVRARCSASQLSLKLPTLIGLLRLARFEAPRRMPRTTSSKPTTTPA
jgi:hypothetical protein